MMVGKYVLVGTPTRTIGFAWPRTIAGNDNAAVPPSTTARRLRLIFVMGSPPQGRVAEARSRWEARKENGPGEGAAEELAGGGGVDSRAGCSVRPVRFPNISVCNRLVATLIVEHPMLPALECPLRKPLIPIGTRGGAMAGSSTLDPDNFPPKRNRKTLKGQSTRSGLDSD